MDFTKEFGDLFGKGVPPVCSFVFFLDSCGSIVGDVLRRSSQCRILCNLCREALEVEHCICTAVRLISEFTSIFDRTQESLPAICGVFGVDSPPGMKGYKVTDSSRLKLFGVACDSLSNLRAKGSSKLGIQEDVYLALDDGTIIDDEEYFKMIPSQTVIIFYKKSEDVVTGADYILNMLRKINAGYLTTGEKARDFLSDKIHDLMSMAKEKDYRKKSNTREEDPDWFSDLDTNAKTKEEYMFRKSQDRIRGYFYKFYGDVRKNPDFVRDAKPRIEINKCIDYFRRKLKEDKYFGCYFDRRCARMEKDEVDSSRSKDRQRSKRWKGEDEVKEDESEQPIYDSYCDSEGQFECQGKWDSKECEFYSKHCINPYVDRESRILFSTWNFDHRIEKSRTILPTLCDAVRNLKDGFLVDYEYFYKLLFTNFNLKLVHVACHDKTVHDISCDMKYVYKR